MKVKKNTTNVVYPISYTQVLSVCEKVFVFSHCILKKTPQINPKIYWQSNTFSFQAESRRADEDMRLYYVCTNVHCCHRWADRTGK